MPKEFAMCIAARKATNDQSDHLPVASIALVVRRYSHTPSAKIENSSTISNDGDDHIAKPNNGELPG